MEFEVLNILLYLAVILLATKATGILARILGLPQVVGMVIAGLLIGPAIFSQIDAIPFNGIINPTPIEMDVLKSFSQVGVVLILFSSGLETDTKELGKSGFAATMVACAGVAVPVALGTVITALFMGGLDTLKDHDTLMNALFVGCILSATSVGITVETLRELGKLKTKVGTTVLSAAIIDDVIGIIVLSVVTSLNGDGSVGMTLLKAAGFFVVAIGLGFPIKYGFVWICKHYPHSRRTGIFALAVCFLYAYVAEKFFGIAAITGAFLAGIMLSGLKDTDFVDKKVLTNGYMIFSPIFFAFIGISADFSAFKPSDLIFGLVFVAVGILGKIIGCGGVAKLCKYNLRDSTTIGCGMIARGEVALAVYTTGHSLIKHSADGTLTGINPLVATIMLIVISSVLCPIFLKLIFGNGEHEPSHETTLHDISTEHREGGK
ncbi:MAG: cation:proton antiporter [Clostridia bacterium]|nr:cation:proton antiporter [Clostridia bacterium]